MSKARDEGAPVGRRPPAETAVDNDIRRVVGGEDWSKHFFTLQIKSEWDDSFNLTPRAVHLPISFLGLITEGNWDGLGYEELGIALRETIGLLRPYGPSKELADSLSARARALRDYADNETILSHILEAITIYETLGDQRELGRAYVTLGTVLRDGGLNYDALTALEKGRELLALVGDPAGEVVATYNEAQICGRLELYEEAIRLLYEGEKGLSAVPQPERLQRAILSSRAQFQEMVGANVAGLESAEALVHLNDVDERATAADRSQASYIRAGMRWRSGAASTALDDYVRAAEEGHQSILGNATLRYRATERRRLDPVYQAALHAALSTGEAEIAFGLLERSKSIGGTFTNSSRVSETLDGEDWQQLRTDAAELRHRAMAVQSDDTDALRSAQDTAEWLVARRDLLLAKSGVDDVEGSALHELAARTQGVLSPNTLLLEYVSVANQLWGIALSPESATAELIDLRTLDVDLLVRSFGYECDGLLEAHALSRLGRSLLDPFSDRLSAAGTVIVVPPTNFAELPFHAMPLSGTPLLETHEVIYLPSAALLTQPRPATQRPAISNQSLCTVFCVPSVQYQDLDQLPGALDEATMVERIFESPNILVGADATSEQLLGLSPDIQVLHLACHAQFEREAPLLARLLLADRPVFSFEIMLMGINVDIVNLNACHTAAARVHLSGEAEGLTSAFAAAGAGTSLASQWALDDAAGSEFSTLFYGELLSDRCRSPRAAARNAQLTLRRRKSTEHPYFWAPFSTVGVPVLDDAL
jgi:tetratricopeptide (TPR) repeat protein